MLAQFKSWNVSMKSMVRLPAVDTFGQVYATDGYFLIGLDETGKPLGPHIKMEPTSGPLFDVAIVAEKFIYLLYKCGFMVAYFTSKWEQGHVLCRLIIIFLSYQMEYHMPVYGSMKL